MIKRSVWLCLLVFIAGATTSAADQTDVQSSAGTIALVSGKAWVRHGQITIPKPEQETTSSPAVTYKDTNGRELGPNDLIQPGDVVVTGDDSYLKIYYKDDSIMDVAPNTTFQVKQFTMAVAARQIEFVLLEGKVRTLVTRALDANSFYRVTTPASAMGVHGTEWVTNTYSQNGQYRTDVTVLEGKVVVDVPRAGSGPGGKSTIEQVSLTPGRTFSGVGGGGAVAKYSVFKMTQSQVQDLVAMIPNIETKRVGALAVTAVSTPSVVTLSSPPEGEAGTGNRSVAAAVRPIPSTDALAAAPNEISEEAGSRRVAFEQQGIVSASAVTGGRMQVGPQVPDAAVRTGTVASGGGVGVSFNSPGATSNAGDSRVQAVSTVSTVSSTVAISRPSSVAASVVTAVRATASTASSAATAAPSISTAGTASSAATAVTLSRPTKR